MKQIVMLYLLLLFPLSILAQKGGIQGTVRSAVNQQILPKAEIYLAEKDLRFLTDQKGDFTINSLEPGTYTLSVFTENYALFTKQIMVAEKAVRLDISLEVLSQELSAVDISDQMVLGSGRHLRGVEGMAIYATKKSDLIQLDELTANLATNNAREVYKNIAGLNIWENDGAGLQLAIGVRGLDPNRTSNFNTRQNGYDISADALGYPESYYTPPTQALQRIEMVRGAASLQYGTQFGGLLNFKLKQGNPDKKVAFTSENTVGSFGFLNSFNSIGGTLGKVNYYSFYQRKQGDGWRPNSGFEQNTAYLDVYYQVNTKLRLGFELTHMNYLAQQAGGLVDFEFQQNPRQSKRARNWFKVNWNLAALHLDYQLSDKTKINFRNFLLDAQRDALGELGPINRPDPGRERDLIVGRYENFGSEGRLLHRYQLGSNLSTLVFGYRYYQGYTTNQQGDASDGSGPDFEFLNPTNLEQSDYEFPSKNLAFFTENLINLGDKWTLTPGIRYEYIRTTADGYYKEKVLSGGQVIFEQQLEDQQKNERQLVLLGLGLGHRLTNEIEAYANISQNYRAINFSDLAQVNPNLVIDSLLEDEKGSTFDIGLRGQAKDNLIRFDLSGFYLRYNNRIGLTALTLSDPILIEKQVAYRTNIGNARVLGLEGFIEADIWRLIKSDDQHLSVRPFINISLLSGKYLSGSNDIIGNQTELTPPLSLKTGFSGNYKRFNWSFLYTFVKAHYSDATNALRVADATRGLIPTYQIMDLSLSYQFKKYRFQTGLNNLANQSYFTRRATGYPGPGIIPANARSFYFTFRFQL